MICDLRSASSIANHKSQITRSFCRGPGSEFRLALRIGERSEFGCHRARDRGAVAPRLEACEIRTIAPCQRPAKALACADRRVVQDVDQTFVVGTSLRV